MASLSRRDRLRLPTDDRQRNACGALLGSTGVEGYGLGPSTERRGKVKRVWDDCCERTATERPSRVTRAVAWNGCGLGWWRVTPRASSGPGARSRAAGNRL